MPCSVIVPAWSLTLGIRQSLDRLLDRPFDACPEILLVGKARDAAAAAWIETTGGRARSVAVDAGSGIAAARNAGASAATRPWLVFLDAWSVPRDGWMDVLVSCAAARPGCGAAGGRRLDIGSIVLHAGVVFGHDRMPRPLYRGLPGDHPAVTRTRTLQAVTGGPLLVSRAFFADAGGFDPRLTSAYIDEDLCLRLGDAGHSIVYCHACVSDGHEPPAVDPMVLAGDTATFRTRWATRVRPDDIEYYMRDGFLRLSYQATGPHRLHVSPLLATVGEGAFGEETGELLRERAERHRDLLVENVALRARIRELEHGPQTFSEMVGTLMPGAGGIAPEDGELAPPEAMATSVGGRFHEDGEEFFRYFRDLAGLQPTDRVLDIGCGVGRMAVRLAPYLTGGSYEGFDIRADVIEWCQQNITPRYPNMRFAFVDLANGFYNTTGATHSAAFRFPYPPESFDFVLLTSVFTHMLPADFERYLAEIAAALKPGGTCFCTYFLITEESLALMRSGLAGLFNFQFRGEGYRTLSPTAPEAALAYDESWVRERYRAHGLAVVDPIRYGHWCGRQDGLSLQDIVIARKELRAA